MAECELSILESGYHLRAEGADGFAIEEAALLSINVEFDQATGEIVSAVVECHPDVTPEVQGQIRRVFLNLDLCLNNPQP